METAMLLAELQVLSENYISSATKHISGNEYKVLLFLKIYGTCSPKVLISKIGILKTNLALVLKKLNEQGFVAIKRSLQDGRGKQYCLTDAGNKFIDEVMAEIFVGIEEHCSENFLNALKIIVGVLNKKV